MYRRIGQFVDTHGQIKTGQLELTEDAAVAGAMTISNLYGNVASHSSTRQNDVDE
jgi:hypothetical protein